MRFLAFDIECARVSKTAAHILSFGYALADENFTVLEQEDILINPGTKIYVHNKKGEGIDLPYTDEGLNTQPKFPLVYRRIRELLEDRDTVVVGHATMNDARYLNLDTQRFHLPPLRFRFYDTQLLCAGIAEDYTAFRGLEHIAKEWGIEYNAHCSMEDALLTLKILQTLCEKEGGFLPMIHRLGVEEGRVMGYEAIPSTTAAYREILLERERKKQQRRENYEKMMAARAAKRARREKQAQNGQKKLQNKEVGTEKAKTSQNKQVPTALPPKNV